MSFFYTLADSKVDEIFKVTSEIKRTRKPHTNQSVSSFYSWIKLQLLNYNTLQVSSSKRHAFYVFCNKRNKERNNILKPCSRVCKFLEGAVLPIIACAPKCPSRLLTFYALSNPFPSMPSIVSSPQKPFYSQPSYSSW